MKDGGRYGAGGMEREVWSGRYGAGGQGRRFVRKIPLPAAVMLALNFEGRSHSTSLSHVHLNPKFPKTL